MPTKKIAGRKCPALVDPSDTVRQGGKGSVWDGDGQTYGRTDGHFQSTSGSLLVHLGIIGGHIRHHSYSSPKKMNFPKSADIHTDGHTDGRKKSDS